MKWNPTRLLLGAMHSALDDGIIVALSAPVILAWFLLARADCEAPSPPLPWSSSASLRPPFQAHAVIIALKGVVVELTGLFIVTALIAVVLHTHRATRPHLDATPVRRSSHRARYFVRRVDTARPRRPLTRSSHHPNAIAASASSGRDRVKRLPSPAGLPAPRSGWRRREQTAPSRCGSGAPR